MRIATRAVLTGFSTLFLATSARAIPGLQIYIAGGTFNGGSETWIAGSAAFDLWVIGNGSQPAVRLTTSFFGAGGSITLTPTTTSAVTDPSTPPVPTFSATGSGGHPQLPPHGIFNDGNLDHWEDHLLGDFTLTDSPIADFDGSEPFPMNFPANGQVNVYHVVVSGWGRVHFDAYSSNGTKTPFSHDGEFNGPGVGVQSMTWSAVKSLY